MNGSILRLNYVTIRNEFKQNVGESNKITKIKKIDLLILINLRCVDFV